jgi:hypothetical protein
MKGLFVLAILGGVFLGALPEIFAPKKQQILNVEPFWKVNGRYTNDGEIFEVFYPPLDKLP